MCSNPHSVRGGEMSMGREQKGLISSGAGEQQAHKGVLRKGVAILDYETTTSLLAALLHVSLGVV